MQVRRLHGAAEVILLGVDPGSNCTALAVLDVSGSDPVRLFGLTIRRTPGMSRPEVLSAIRRRGRAVARKALRAADERSVQLVVGVEQVHMRTWNPMSGLRLAEARAVVVEAIQDAVGARLVPIFDVQPSTAKLAATGSGRASKGTVKLAMRGLAGCKVGQDEADAMAVALGAWGLMRKQMLTP
ncbi:MAG: hypothetical protein GF355_07075 [Candidatus Eisenbacteria bacterium]|nr:hypothetical protein [Candidatus Eisenbacteria bacterium]